MKKKLKKKCGSKEIFALVQTIAHTATLILCINENLIAIFVVYCLRIATISA